MIVWKIYLLFCVFQLVMTTRESINNFILPNDLINLLLMSIGLIGLWGFITKKKIFTQLVWKTVLPVYFIWTATNLIWIWTVRSPDIPDNVVLISLLGVFIISLPQFWGLYKYGFKNNELWVGARENNA